MKNKIFKNFVLLSILLLVFNATNFVQANAFSNELIVLSKNDEIDWNVYDDFVKYDLCITDYENITEEEKNLCKFIFETEYSDSNIRCERARRILEKKEVPARLTIEDVQDIGFIVDPDLPIKAYGLKRVFAVPDVTYSEYKHEYWLDDSGNKRILFYEFDNYLEYIELYDTKPEIDKDLTIEYDENSEKYILCQQIELDQTHVPEYTYDIWKYVILPNDTALIVNSTLPKGNNVQPIDTPVIIPEEIDGHIVSGIYDAFSNTGITKLVIPQNVKYCGMNNLKYLTELEVNSPELSIEGSFFFNCPELKSVTLNVKEICAPVFIDCPKLEQVEIVEVKKIAEYAFERCTNLKSITLPKNIEMIGQKAFTKDCTIKGYYNTAAHRYALINNLNFCALDSVSYGDINQDGNINIADIVIIQKHILGNGSANYAADMNRDGRIDVFDMVLIRKEIL